MLTGKIGKIIKKKQWERSKKGKFSPKMIAYILRLFSNNN